jgi:hypothetical protein
MARELDLVKRREWEERLGEFRASGLTIARFCANERVSVNTFYYWSKRLGKPGGTAPSAACPSAAAGLSPSARGAEPASTSRGELVHFRLAAGIEVSVPAQCLDVIRCLAESAKRHGAQAAQPQQSGGFHELVLGARR